MKWSDMARSVAQNLVNLKLEHKTDEIPTGGDNDMRYYVEKLYRTFENMNVLKYLI